MKVNGVRVTSEDIDDVMVSALEGGITYWCDEAVVVGQYLGDFASDQISRGGMLKLHANEDDEWFILTKEKFLHGLEMELSDAKERITDVDENGERYLDPGDIDGVEADNIVQYALFGELVYS